jgi:Divergent InlB B-repeat domain
VTRALRVAVLAIGVLVIGVGPAGSDPGVVRDVTFAGLPNAAPRVAAATAWCGTASQSDRTPNVVAGSPVHWVYLLPSDGQDQLAAVASVMQADAEQIDGWWRGQDPTRTPRNDVATFSCGTQLDVTVVRSSRSGAQLAPLSGRFASLSNTVEQSGLGSPFTKVVAYYDGPSADENVCGQGGSDSTGFGVAVVYYQACAGVSTAAVVAHELLHTFGAVATGAPHECTGENAGHTCDVQQDLMYPAIGNEPLSAKVLDPGRDDYYGHPGGWTDTQDSAWLVRLDSQTPLGLTVSGPGSVTSDVPGLQCAASCTTTWNSGQRLSLSATPSPGARLMRWTGACSGAAGCSVTVTPGAAVSAFFAPASFRLTVAVSGKGTVRSARSGIACRPRCSSTFASYVPVRLNAAPAKGWKLRSWSGACKGSKATCSVPMRAVTKARATFVRA